MSWKTNTDIYPEIKEDVLGRIIHDRSSLLGNIGKTPLLRIRRIAPVNHSVEIYAKAEWFNPGGSIKDRPALSMILEAEHSGELTREKTIIDATSGNTGIA